MPVIQLVLSVVVATAAGAALGVALSRWRLSSRAEGQRRVLVEAEEAARGLRAEVEGSLELARREAEAIVEARRREADTFVEARRQEVQRMEERLERREAGLSRRDETVSEREGAVNRKEAEAEALRAEMERALTARRHELERAAGMNAAEARGALVAEIQDEAKREAMVHVRQIEERARQEADRRARNIVTLAIQRVAHEQVAEATVSVLALPNDDMKGRIIGREGRNIRAFEQVTGVNLIIDDTPEAVTLSCFDPVRREKARTCLERLVADGRIHPSRIEDAYLQAGKDVELGIVSAGEWAISDVGIADMHPELIKVLGRLRFRTSYGQNVLLHLVEAAHIAGIMAAELGTDIGLAKRGTLLHDIGKAVTHEVEGSHALIGAELARRLREEPGVCHSIAAHHGEVEQRTIEAVITQAADAVSGARPGARRDTIESYIKRLERLEAIAESYEGVAKAYAMQAGRDIRVMVNPKVVDDVGAQVMARDIAKQIEAELTYPGQIRVMVVRELRSTEYAK